MKNKTIRNITIVSIALVGASYVLKSIKLIKKQQKIKDLKASNMKNNNSLHSCVLNGEVHYEIDKDPFLMEEDKMSDFSKFPDRKYYVLSKLPDRRYHVLSRKKLNETSQSEQKEVM